MVGGPTNVRFGSLADIPRGRDYVRFTPKSGHEICRAQGEVLIFLTAPTATRGAGFSLLKLGKNIREQKTLSG